jgi:hypothetical protein
MKKDPLEKTNLLIQHVPVKSEKSCILNDYQISNLIENFHALYKTKPWELVFTLSRDGVSVGTFYEKCREYTSTMIVV